MNTYPIHSRSIGFWTHHLAMAFRNRVDERLAGIGLTMGESMPLLLLHHLGEQSLVELARRMNFAHPSVLRHIDILERKGLAVREPDSLDRRVKKVRLTPAGEALINPIHEILAEIHSRAIAGLSAEEVETIQLLLRKLFLNLCHEKECPAEFYRMVRQEVDASACSDDGLHCSQKNENQQP